MLQHLPSPDAVTATVSLPLTDGLPDPATAVVLTTINVLLNVVTGQIQLFIQPIQQDTYLPAQLMEIAGQEAKPGRAVGLTPREVEVLQHIANGLTYRQIADKLVISHRTVDHHLESIYGKLGVSSRHAAAAWARRHSLV